MTPINSSNIVKGIIVYYKYSKVDGEPNGPFKVRGFHRDYEGEHLLLRQNKIDGEDRTVSLATDEDFGAPLFYTP